MVVRVTHPFHPLSGQELELVGFKHTRHGERVWYRIGDGARASISKEWTNLKVPDAFELASGGRACFRADDLVALADCVDALRAARAEEHDDV